MQYKNFLELIQNGLMNYDPHTFKNYSVLNKHKCWHCGNECVTCCAKCKKIYYCNEKCQLFDWQKHRLNCY